MPPRPIEAVLSRLSGVTSAGDGYKAICPAHKGGHESDPSLSVREGDQGQVLLNCFAENCGFDQVVAALGMEKRDLFPHEGGGNGHGKASGRVGKARIGGGAGEEPDAGGRVTLASLGERCGLDPRFLGALGLHDSPRGVVVPYLDEGGAALHDKLRTALGGKGKYRYATKGTKAAPYGLWRLPQVREGPRALVLVEGESDCWTLWRHGLPALGIPGASNYAVLEAAHVAGVEKVFVVQEPGAAGELFVGGLAQRLSELGWQGEGYVVAMPEGSKDPNELHKRDSKAFPQAFRECCERGVPLRGPSIEDMFVTAAEVEERPVDFLWYPYLMRGELNLLMGKPGEGKGQICMSLAAAVSRGGLMPGSVLPVDAADVLVFAPEDSVDKAIVPRLRSAGANMERVRIFRFREHAFSFGEDDLARLELAIGRWRPGLVIFDPIVSFMGDRVDTNRATQVRATLQPVHRIAERTNACLLLVAHLRKGSVGSALDGLYGSVDFGAIVRSALGVYPDQQPGVVEGLKRGVLAHVKTNLSITGQSLGFEIRANEDRTSTFRWSGDHRMSAEELAAGGGGAEDRNAFAEACELIRGFVHGGQEVASADVHAAATRAGIGRTTVDKARRTLGIDWRREGFGPNSRIMWFELGPGEVRGQRQAQGGGNPEARKEGRAPF